MVDRPARGGRPIARPGDEGGRERERPISGATMNAISYAEKSTSGKQPAASAM
jgi:hypothetical protein